jgi:UDP-N-acetylmuramoyl-L-alanyl-D-glutamate--2,6-diaminopimelate ligase
MNLIEGNSLEKRLEIYNMLKKVLKKMLPNFLLQLYHLVIARVAQIRYGNPSDKLIVIGVTGTNGKSSTVQFAAQILNLLGVRVGYTTTAGFMIAGQEIENKLKMTMPGRFQLQKLLRDMVKAKCEVAIVETSSQGLDQFRHLGINYDIAVFTNLTPEHIEAHGGFENYKKAKAKLFQHTQQSKKKIIAGKVIEKVAVINGDDEYGKYYQSFMEKVKRFGFSDKDTNFDVMWEDYRVDKNGATGVIIGESVKIRLIGKFQHYNVLAAISTVLSLGYSMEQIAKVLEKLTPIPGRLQMIDQGQPFSIIVDYAYEPYALKALFEVVDGIVQARKIGIHGSAGGGRDKARRPVIGKMAVEFEDITIITNEDPYDEDPAVIIKEVAEGAKTAGGIVGEDLFLIYDRAEAIEFACKIAKEGDVVMVTGKGSETVMAVGDGLIPWSDIAEVKNVLVKLGYGETKNRTS